MQSIKILTKSFPDLPSKKRQAYLSTDHLTEEAKEDIFKQRNRENAALTRKRLRIYADFLDKTIAQLTAILNGEEEYVPDETPLPKRPPPRRRRRRNRTRKVEEGPI